ncbi:extracellular solute-binding protein [Aureimonas pseudogalii]|uniref:Microcin C transport system substrate-binding protein n=1 Tax=Aureimonas pseudogalii TaxID=1744844 RepID=A0A7W6EC20_9HYPH|nr:extracellular solute-binding protein [Aureimonas pseudogalii]MBB3996492.1 microcin C transport system substrate-binding protein [Aureimonas pseudogalii]
MTESFRSITRRRFGAMALAAMGSATLPRVVFAATPTETPVHGLSAFGDLKYPADYAAFDYASPEAPQGGRMVMTVPSWLFNQAPDTFDTFNTFVLQGNAPPRIELLYEGLMLSTLDEPDALYGHLAESVTLSTDRNRFTFRLRPEARFSTGAPVTAADVAFSYERMKTEGHPSLAIALAEVAEVTAEDERTLHVTFTGRQTVPTALAALSIPVVPKAFFESRPFAQGGFDEIPGSGAYRIGRYAAGRYIEYEKRDDHWARDMPFTRGLSHFQTLRVEFFRDRQAELEAFKKGDVTYREEFTTRAWATEYDFPAVKDGRVKKATFPGERWPRFQCWALNQRRERFADPRVRRAVNLCFDFEWTNANLLFGLRQHSVSPFQTSDFVAAGAPPPEELAILEPLRGQLMPEVFGAVWVQPVSDGSGRDRARLREAADLFAAAGWTRRGQSLVNGAGETFRLEYLINQPEQARVYGKMIENLKLVGVDASLRLVDAAQYQDRQNRFDFDMILCAFSLNGTPTRESLGLFFGSAARNRNGSYNYPGMADPAVDALIDRLGAAASREELTVVMRCLDRVLRWRLDWIPNIGSPGHTVGHWDMFGFREPKPDYGFPVESLWWYDETKAKAVGRA